MDPEVAKLVLDQVAALRTDLEEFRSEMGRDRADAAQQRARDFFVVPAGPVWEVQRAGAVIHSENSKDRALGYALEMAIRDSRENFGGTRVFVESQEVAHFQLRRS